VDIIIIQSSKANDKVVQMWKYICTLNKGQIKYHVWILPLFKSKAVLLINKYFGLFNVNIYENAKQEE
jgi:hypothetical protein